MLSIQTSGLPGICVKAHSWKQQHITTAGRFIGWMGEGARLEGMQRVTMNKEFYLVGVARWIERRLQTKGLWVRFPVRAHAWVMGQVPSGGHMGGNHTLMFLSFSLSFPSPLSKDKEIKPLKKKEF